MDVFGSVVGHGAMFGRLASLGSGVVARCPDVGASSGGGYRSVEKGEAGSGYGVACGGCG